MSEAQTDTALTGFSECSDLAALLADSSQLLDCIHNPIVIVNCAGTVAQCNRSFLDLVDLERNQAIGLPLSRLIEDTELLRILKTGKPETMRRVHIQGKVYLSNRTLLRAQGVSIGAVAVLHDVSELEAVSSELRSLTLLMRELDATIEGVHEGIYIADAEGRTLRVNQAYERLAGVRREEVLGHSMQDLVAQGVIDQSVTLRVLHHKQPESLLQRLRSGIRAVVSGTPLFDENGEIYRVVTSVRDVDELIRLREKLEQTATLNDEYRRELHHLRSVRQAGIVCRTPGMRGLIELAARVARVDSNVLIMGESGVGKEMFAELIHANSARSGHPFIKINCTAIPEQLFESEFFGYTKGAFTGASRQGKAGIFEAANGGTILLDEMGDMPLAMQAKLLRVIQERRVTRIGDVLDRKVDVRLLCASNRDLRTMVSAGQFREDLYYRLSVVPIVVPPLRERREDIPFLIHEFLEKYCSRYGLERSMHPAAIEALTHRPWPGNVRELENLIERMVVTASSATIRLEELPPPPSPQSVVASVTPCRALCRGHSPAPSALHGRDDSSLCCSFSLAAGAGKAGLSASFTPPSAGIATDQLSDSSVSRTAGQLSDDAYLLRPLRETLDEVETRVLRAAFGRYKSSRKVAAVLGIDQSTVLRKARRLGLVASLVSLSAPANSPCPVALIQDLSEDAGSISTYD